MYNRIIFKESERLAHPLFHLEAMDVRRAADEVGFVWHPYHVVQKALVCIGHSVDHILDDVVNVLWAGAVYSFLLKLMVQHM